MNSCPNCHGLGFSEDSDELCHVCEGSGQLKEPETKPEPPPFDFANENDLDSADWWKTDTDPEVPD